MDYLKDWTREVKEQRQRLSKLRERVEALEDQDARRSVAAANLDVLEEASRETAGERERVKAALLDAIVEGDAGAERTHRGELKKLSERAEQVRTDAEHVVFEDIDPEELADVAAELASWKSPSVEDAIAVIEQDLRRQAEELRTEVRELRASLPSGVDGDLYSAAREHHDPRYRAEMRAMRAQVEASERRNARDMARAWASQAPPRPVQPTVTIETPEDDRPGLTSEDIYAALRTGQ